MKFFQISKKRVAAFATAAVMAFGALVAFAPVDVYASPRVFYSLAQDEMMLEQEPGHTKSVMYPAEWMNAGPAEFQIVEAPRGHNGIRSFNRGEDWSGIDFEGAVVGVNFATDDYSLLMSGRVSTDMEMFAIQGISDPWPHIFTIEDFGANGSFEVFIPSTRAAIEGHEGHGDAFTSAMFQRFVRINPVGSRGDFYIYEFIVAEAGATRDAVFAAGAPFAAEGEADETPAAPVTPAAPGGVDDGVIRFTVGSTAYAVGSRVGTLDAAPFNQDGRVMVPLRQIGEAIGASNITMEGNTVIVDDIRLDIGVALPGDMGAAVIVDGRTFVPLGYIAQRIGATPRWDGATNSAYITLG